MGLHMAAQGLQMHHVDVHGVYGRWLPGHQDPRIQVMRSRGGKVGILGATPPSRLLDTASKIQETSMQHTACRHRCRMQGCKGYRTQDTRMQRIQDAGSNYNPSQPGGPSIEGPADYNTYISI